MSEEADHLKWQRATSGFERARLNLLVALITLTVGAWALTLYQALEMSAPMDIAVRGGVTSDGMSGMAMAGMPAGGWSFAGAITFVALWTVMMAAMMLPAAAPMILIFASAQAQRASDAGPDVDFRRRVFVRLGLGRGARLCSRPDRERYSHSAYLFRACPLGASCARRDVGHRGALSVHADETHLPYPLPFAFCFCGALLARRPTGCTTDGYATRRLLLRLLLGSVRCAGGSGRDEPSLDASSHRCGVRGEGASRWPASREPHRPCFGRSWIGGGRRSGLKCRVLHGRTRREHNRLPHGLFSRKVSFWHEAHQLHRRCDVRYWH
jgi:Predicted metal-binding integral membrane protein (DUF2182)